MTTFKIDPGFIMSVAVGTLVGTFLDELLGLEEMAERLAARVLELVGGKP